jgi:hypothetical protein
MLMEMPTLTAAEAESGNASIGVAIRPATSSVVAIRFTRDSPSGPGMAQPLERNAGDVVDAGRDPGRAAFIMRCVRIQRFA